MQHTTHNLMHTETSHGRILGYAHVPLEGYSVVSAGTPCIPPTLIPGSRKRLLKFLLTDDWLSDLGARSGDILFIDTAPVGYRDRTGFDGDIVMARTHFGLIVGYYRHHVYGSYIDVADGSGQKIIETPEMVIQGVVVLMKKTPRWGRYPDGTEGEMF